MYGPKRDDAVNDRPAASVAVRQLQVSGDMAKGLDVTADT
jgi:hypothetical protein